MWCGSWDYTGDAWEYGKLADHIWAQWRNKGPNWESNLLELEHRGIMTGKSKEIREQTGLSGFGPQTNNRLEMLNEDVNSDGQRSNEIREEECEERRHEVTTPPFVSASPRMLARREAEEMLAICVEGDIKFREENKEKVVNRIMKEITEEEGIGAYSLRPRQRKPWARRKSVAHENSFLIFRRG
ncbi:hypothetical protein PIB30_039155 [Stylosanthes scabra]|uniref:Uncharacterized protein n=1 Tax=Stylosanthes scabra TaxID=79078 RepID=A0ABU6VCZ5_9FABA|nr:hypothetical protein [Stylosanthes scabra]